MYTGAILAGGLSLRMGTPKEGVRMPDGHKMIEHVIEPLSHVCQKIVIVGTCYGFTIPLQEKFITLSDDPSGRGPLSAIATLLKSGIDQDGYLVTACDQPFLTPDLLRLLLGEKTSVPRIFQSEPNEMLTPFPGYYPISWLSIIENLLASAEYGLCSAILKGNFKSVPVPIDGQKLIRNINTPTDVKTFIPSANLP